MIFGERKARPAIMNQEIAKTILSCQDDESFKTVLGGTLCTDDFYEGVCINIMLFNVSFRAKRPNLMTGYT